MRLRLLPLFAAPLALLACTSSGPRSAPLAGGPAARLTTPAAADTVADPLFFGRSIPGGGTVSDSAWAAFLAEVVTPRFPDGLTVWRGEGQWLDSRHTLEHEQSMVVEIVHPASAEVDAALEAIAAEYKRRFRQDAVMRITIPARMRFYE